MAPECVRNQGTYRASDVWSLGVILHQLYTGLHPFRGGSDYLVFKRSTGCDFNIPLDHYPASVLPPAAATLITRLLALDPNKRPTLPELVADPFFAMGGGPTPDDQVLRTVCDDLIRRHNVYKLEGVEKLRGHLSEALGHLECAGRREHVRRLAEYFIFEGDPWEEEGLIKTDAMVTEVHPEREESTSSEEEDIED